MRKRMLVVVLVALVATLSAAASDRDDAAKRINHANQVFNEIMDAPDQAIPAGLLEKAQCIAIIPGDVKFAFIFGGNYGRGVAVCRTGREKGQWSAPLFLAVGGGSVGYQIGGSSTDLVLLFMNQHALHSLLSDRFKLGADASVAAGPVGRTATADTDIKLNAEILSYSRAKGVFAGVSLSGAVVKSDDSSNEAMYGASADRQTILDGKTLVPEDAKTLLHSITQFAG
jgi:SH3 domain-containing YSC84-like protein 1